MANERILVRDFFDTEDSPGLTIGATSTSLTEAIYDAGTTAAPAPPAKYALLTVETDQIRWFADGTTPTSTFGHLANVTDVIELHGESALRNFRAIRVAGSATLQVSYAR